MNLEDFKIPYKEIGLPGGDKLSVRGLCVEDVLALILNHKQSLSELFDKYSRDPNVPDFSEGEFTSGLVNEFPALAAEVIAHACDAPKAADKARKLPLPVQVQAIQAVLLLTFSTVDEAKKFIELVTETLRKTPSVVAQLQA